MGWLLFLYGFMVPLGAIKRYMLFVRYYLQEFSQCHDFTCRVFVFGKGKKMATMHVSTFLSFTAAVQALAIHATSDYFVTASLDNSWCFYDISSGLCLGKVGDVDEKGYTSASFHPDGHTFGAGTSKALVKIWDARSQSNVAKLDGHTGPVTVTSFSENGCVLATAADDGVRLWDLRNEQSINYFATIAPYSDTRTNFVEFDHSGRYLAMAGLDVRVYEEQDWKCIKIFDELNGEGVPLYTDERRGLCCTYLFSIHSFLFCLFQGKHV